MPFEFDHFLVLDDDPLVSEILQRTLKVTVFGFANSHAFLSHAQQLNPRVVFVDVHVGDTDNGLEMIEIVKKNWPSAPIIVVTSDRTEEIYSQAIRMGAHDVLHKPFKPQEVRRTCKTQLLHCQQSAGSLVLC